MGKIIFSCLILLSLLTVKIGYAQEIIVYDRDINDNYIGKNISILEDKEGKFSVSDVLNIRNKFAKSNQSVLNLGVSETVHWLNFRILNRSEFSRIILSVNNPNLKSIDLYLLQKGLNGSRIIKKLKKNDFDYENFVYEIDIARNSTFECFIRVKSDIQLQLPIVLNSPVNLIKTVITSEMLTGLYLGIMLVMLLYNLFVYTASRDRSYLYYVNYIFWVAVTQAAFLGFFHRIIHGEDSSTWTSNLLIFSGAMSGIGSVLFVKSFLHTNVFIPKLEKYLNIIIVGDIVAIGILFLGYPVQSYNVVNAVAGLGSIFVLLVAVIVYNRGYKPAAFFLLAWSIFLISVIIFVLKDYGVVTYNFFSVHAVQIGSALEAVLLSFALANKINLLIVENEQTQAEALKVATENERIIKEQNVILELKVDERTSELKESNEELNNTLSDLQMAQSKLIESEKMASLGQLTAGIAHEINNPINFVTSNISPLQRDIDMLLEAANQIEIIGKSDSSVEEKKEIIASYKESLDFDYLILEIQQLLKGMFEGASRTADIVKGLRIFSREDDDSLKKANVNESLESTMIILNTLIERITITREYSELPLLDCYPGKLNQVYLNIITNCIHAVKKQYPLGDGGHLFLKTYLSDNYVNILIKDNGTGMAESTQKKLFEPFFTTKDVGEGTGLGMFISYNIIKKHYGEIIVNSKEGEGAEFLLLLPLNLTSQIESSKSIVN